MPDKNGHPSVEEMELGAIFSALGDPLRLKVVLALAADPADARMCGSFELPVAKATRTYHFRVLRESGLIRQVDHGNGRSNTLRLEELRQRFPALVELILTEAKTGAFRPLKLEDLTAKA
ncbi:ArsR/SmtB family transcription factor [Roseibium suaedae]|uniref:DNA-binding transcriptional regulator, ArsR family n=1 Tax=Roseibium suaedae TaxID=735517 RepID=A0A1M7PCX7_9HYPH|nr:helix-turn-helix domain-containing protein [Roseibium suaedae]SHN14691.1 DNA-binding transcriptional regulator, ArsR family [Roseibium suaedae]